VAVFVVQEVHNKNLLPAKKFGSLKLMLPPGNIVLSAVPTVRRLRKALKDYTIKDYILLIGDPIAIALAGSIASEMNAGKVNYLKWDRQSLDYIPLETDIYGRVNEE
tara:strand:+ start:107 stop:427 length:321 start_codon:yes stop_codon:yes gene_type:complete